MLRFDRNLGVSFIAPCQLYERRISGLVTNFHQPCSTLLMLVAAFCGGQQEMSLVYEEAMANGYRFLSYGDSSLLLS